MRATTRPVGLGLVLACLSATLAIGAAVKAPCASGRWGDGRQYARLCYTDIVPLYGAEQLEGGRLPFLDRCRPGPGSCDEYPVLTMWAMRAAAWFSHDYSTFFVANAVFLFLAAVAIALCLYLIVGVRALYFALAPTLSIYALMNWDLLAVALATAATLAFLNRRAVWAGTLIGLGAAAKLFPALLAVAFVAERMRQREPVAGVRLVWASAAAWLVANLPFALLAPAAWWTFFGFNAERQPDWDSLWFIACHRLAGIPPGQACGNVPFVNAASLVVFIGIVAWIWRAKARRHPEFPRWTLGLPILVVFLLSNKVYSPQYGLWLLPWFALALPDLRLFAAFQAADVAVFVTRFHWFGRLEELEEGLAFGWFEAAILVRSLVLVLCLIRWVHREPERLPGESPVATAAGAA